MDENINPPERGLEELEKKLYERAGGDFKVRRTDLSPIYRGVNTDWPTGAGTPPKKGSNAWLKVLIGSFIFFLLAVGAAYYIFTSDSNVVSDKNIDIAVQGPVSIKAGDELDLGISITNKNATAIDQVELTTGYPVGTRDPLAPTKEISFLTNKIGNIGSGETVNLAVKALIFGKENDEPEIKMTLRYHLAGSNTLFEKEVTYRLKIIASPIDLSVTIPPETNSNQELNISIRAKANSDKPLTNVLIQVAYPSGFQFKSANIAPTEGNNKWRLGDLAPGVEREISIRGVIEGEAEQIKAFEVQAGTSQTATDRVIGILYNDLFKTLTVKKSFLGLSFNENEKGSDGILTQSPARPKKYVLAWANNLSVPMENVKLVGRFSGTALDKGTVSSLRSYYSSVDNLITWNKQSYEQFASLDAGVSGELELTFGSVPLISGNSSLKNPEIDLDLTLSGTRVSEGFANEVVQTDLSRKIKIDSQVIFKADSLYRDGPFPNSGPVPPVSEKETTYTIRWVLVNSSNDVRNALVSAVLPPGIKWIGLTSPSSENVTYDEATRKVTWEVGTIKAGVGVDLLARHAFFQVAITPSVNQIGVPAPLTSVADFNGDDTWSGSALTVQADALSTDIMQDSAYKSGDGVVK